jgi:CBS domain-containing protein
MNNRDYRATGGAPAGGGIAVAKDVMNSSPRTCSRFSRVIEAVLIFNDEDCGLVPVVEEGKPIGVVTDRDVALALATYDDLVNEPIENIMKGSIVSVAPSTPLSEVVQTFGSEAVRRLLVVDAEGLLVGVIGWKDVCGQVTDRALGRVVTEVVESPTQSE